MQKKMIANEIRGEKGKGNASGYIYLARLYFLLGNRVVLYHTVLATLTCGMLSADIFFGPIWSRAEKRGGFLPARVH